MTHAGAEARPAGTAGPPADHPDATKALVLGVVALAGGLVCLVPMLVGPYAWLVGQRTLRAIDAEPGRWGGRSQAQAGQVLGVLATLLLGLGLLVLVGLLGFFLFTFVFLEAQLNEPFPGSPA